MELDRECILERSRLVSVAPARMPYIGFFGKYNKRWYVDIVALPHNSVRTLISELFALLAAVHRLSLDMTAGDFETLFRFLREFAGYTRAVLGAEERVVWAEVDGALRRRADDYAGHALHPARRAERVRRVGALLDGLMPEALSGVGAVAAAAGLQRTADELARQLLEYFAVEEREVPRYFARSIRGPKDKTRLEGRVIEYFGSLKQEYHYAALLTMHLQNEQVRLDFEQRHFGKAGARGRFRAAARRVRDEIQGIPRAFEAAARRYEARFSVGEFLQHYGKDRDVEARTQIV